MWFKLIAYKNQTLRTFSLTAAGMLANSGDAAKVVSVSTACSSGFAASAQRWRFTSVKLPSIAYRHQAKLQHPNSLTKTCLIFTESSEKHSISIKLWQLLLCISNLLCKMFSLVFLLRQEGYVFVNVCLFVSNFVQKLRNRFAWNFQGRLAMHQSTND